VVKFFVEWNTPEMVCGLQLPPGKLFGFKLLGGKAQPYKIRGTRCTVLQKE
jgi:hypothetical protein